MQFTLHEKHDQIISLLEEYLIHPKGNGLGHVYDHLFKYYNKETDIKKPHRAFANIEDFKHPIRAYFDVPYNKSLFPQKDYITTIGIDLPSYFTSNNPTKRTMMICAMDPLTPSPSNPKDFKKPNTDVLFGVPFDLIELSRNAEGSLKENGPFFQQLSTEYNLYVTDLYKVFFRLIADKDFNTEIIDKNGNAKLDENGHKIPFIISNTITAYKNKVKLFTSENKPKTDLHSFLFAKEIELINPDIILTLGRYAKDKILKMDHLFNKSPKQKNNDWKSEADFIQYNWNGTNKIRVISSPHISGAARGTRTQIFNTYNVEQEDRVGNRATKKMAELLMNYINEKTTV